jgi:hypothetical protein
MQKPYLFSLQIGMPQANALNSIGYMDTVLFLTIVKPDIYPLNGSGKWQQFLSMLPIITKIGSRLT